MGSLLVLEAPQAAEPVWTSADDLVRVPASRVTPTACAGSARGRLRALDASLWGIAIQTSRLQAPGFPSSRHQAQVSGSAELQRALALGSRIRDPVRATQEIPKVYTSEGLVTLAGQPI